MKRATLCLQVQKKEKKAILCRIYEVTACIRDSVPKQTTKKRQAWCKRGIKESCAQWERQCLRHVRLWSKCYRSDPLPQEHTTKMGPQTLSLHPLPSGNTWLVWGFCSMVTPAHNEPYVCRWMQRGHLLDTDLRVFSRIRTGKEKALQVSTQGQPKHRSAACLAMCLKLLEQVIWKPQAIKFHWSAGRQTFSFTCIRAAQIKETPT